MMKLPFAKDSVTYILFLLVLSGLFYFLFWPLSVLGLLLTAFILFFFRDPERRIPEESDIIISPADGVVMSVTPMYEETYLKAEAIKVSIFLSIFNVHINRSPIEGVVRYTKYRPGKFLPAFKSHASDINERNTIGIEGKRIRILVHQITGFVARRIVCHVKEGDHLHIGDRFGLIKFGSCTEIVVPASVEIKVKPGDKVRGATTIIGVIH